MNPRITIVSEKHSVMNINELCVDQEIKTMKTKRFNPSVYFKLPFALAVFCKRNQ